MAPPTPTQLAWRVRIEAGLRVAAPFLDLLLAAGDRISRAVDRDGLDAPAPARAEIEPGYAPRRVGPGAQASRRRASRTTRALPIQARPDAERTASPRASGDQA